MVGELWLETGQVGKELIYAAIAAATRKVYWRDPRTGITRASRPQRFAVGRRDNVLGHTQGPKEVSGEAAFPVSADEILEPALISIKGGVTATTPSAGVYLYTFTPGALDSLTLEQNDGARDWIASGIRGNTFRIAGSVDGENIVTVGLFGADKVLGAPTSGLTDRIPTFMEGWETKLYIDGFGATPGTTVIPGTLINWEINYNNNLGRKYFADNTQAQGATPTGELQIDARCTFEASAAAASDEFTNWINNTKRLIQLEFGQNSVIASTYKRFVKVSIPGAWSVVDLGGNDNGTRTYQFSYQYVYDPTNAYGFQLQAQSSRSAPW
jgi:hypothetical protein